MKTVLRILDAEAGQKPIKEIHNPYNMIPSKGNYVTHNEEIFTVEWVEIDYDDNVVYIVVK